MAALLFYDLSLSPPTLSSLPCVFLFSSSDYVMLPRPARSLHAHGNERAHAITQIETRAGALLEAVHEGF